MKKCSVTKRKHTANTGKVESSLPIPVTECEEISEEAESERCRESLQSQGKE